MTRLEAEAIVHARRQSDERNFEKDHGMDECVERLLCEPRCFIPDAVPSISLQGFTLEEAKEIIREIVRANAALPKADQLA